jgi:hypothetical protein
MSAKEVLQRSGVKIGVSATWKVGSVYLFAKEVVCKVLKRPLFSGD